MKKLLSLLLSAALLLTALSACQKTSPRSKLPERQPAATEVVSALMPASGYTGQTENLEYMNAGGQGDELLGVYLENAYGLSNGAWEDAAIIRAVGASAFELAVLRLKNEFEAIRAADLLASYLDGRRGDFVGYAPEQAELVENAGIAQMGTYVALCVCPNPEQAKKAFRQSLSGDDPAGIAGILGVLPSGVLPSQPLPTEPVPSKPLPTEPLLPDWFPQSSPPATPPQETPYVARYPGRHDFIQPNIDDMSVYDTSAILSAWKLGSPVFLSGYDKDIYNAAREVLDAVIRDGMSDLEKETAVYYWMVNNINYDWTHQDLLSETPRESFTPYGGLVNHTAVCLGYATTFQLLMDMAGVECITVVGASDSSREDHGWNMVRLNGNWYCVDVTWDANYREYYGYRWGQQENWRYFNVTSDRMALEHQWDYANIPEAVTGGNGR